ncbi:competence protein ComK [Virgibacillus siamensis]|uniref:competence protein ComK n=1 Tax=Virgibacillus siamensis TaxID=480071 RepID=UPI000985F91A|nr:competence protein ComK [Virgibacillus siamensis]
MTVAGVSPVYIINQHTKAILMKDSSYYRSLILDNQGERHSKYWPEEIIDHSCLPYFSSLEGRRKSVKKLVKIHNKVPIPVIPGKGVYMLPTASAKSMDCVWLSYYQIERYEQQGDKTYVEFRDGTGLYINTSEKAFDKQFQRTGDVIARMSRSIFFDRGLPWI